MAEHHATHPTVTREVSTTVEILFWLPFPGVMLACALGLMMWHLRSWRSQQAAGLEPRELEYRRRQFRRRMQTSAILALIALALPLGMWILHHDPADGAIWPKAGAVLWGAVILLVMCLGLLALADMWATNRYYGKLRHDYRVEQARLESELRRIQAKKTKEGNGKPSTPYPGIGPNAKGKGPKGG